MRKELNSPSVTKPREEQRETGYTGGGRLLEMVAQGGSPCVIVTWFEKISILFPCIFTESERELRGRLGSQRPFVKKGKCKAEVDFPEG